MQAVAVHEPASAGIGNAGPGVEHEFAVEVGCRLQAALDSAADQLVQRRLDRLIDHWAHGPITIPESLSASTRRTTRPLLTEQSRARRVVGLTRRTILA